MEVNLDFQLFFSFQRISVSQIHVLMEVYVNLTRRHSDAVAWPIILAQHVKHVCSILIVNYTH